MMTVNGTKNGSLRAAFTPEHYGNTTYYVLNVTASVILLLIICIGNSMILFLVVKHRSLQSISVKPLLIAGMTLHDLATGIVVTPIHIINVLELEDIIGIKCLAINIFTFTVHIVSGYTPLLLALERFVAIVFPFRYPVLVTERKVYASLTIIWIYGLLVGCMPLMGWNNIQTGDNMTYCHVEHFADGRYLGFIYLGNVIPCMIGQIGFYIKIIMTARSQARRISMENKRGQPQLSGISIRKSDRRGILILALSSVFFILSYLPVILETSIDFNFYTSKSLAGDMWSSELFYIGDIIILANAAINPVFYVYSNREYRIKIKRMFFRSPPTVHELEIRP